VVLNSLTSPGMVGGALALLRRGGRLVEIGKRDVWSGAAVAAQRPDVAYSLLAVDFLPDSEVQAALRVVAAGAASGALRPLPLAAHPLSGVAAALRQLSQVRISGRTNTNKANTQSASQLSCPRVRCLVEYQDKEHCWHMTGVPISEHLL
jgi:NADPH:quinone reductase-like Zn-dependent oxidoreductase